MCRCTYLTVRTTILGSLHFFCFRFTFRWCWPVNGPNRPGLNFFKYPDLARSHYFLARSMKWVVLWASLFRVDVFCVLAALLHLLARNGRAYEVMVPRPQDTITPYWMARLAESKWECMRGETGSLKWTAKVSGCAPRMLQSRCHNWPFCYSFEASISISCFVKSNFSMCISYQHLKPSLFSPIMLVPSKWACF